MTTQTDELLAFYAAEFGRETGCKWEATRSDCRDHGREPALRCAHNAEGTQCRFVNALEGKLKRWIIGNDVIADYSAEPIGIAEWHRRVVEMRK